MDRTVFHTAGAVASLRPRAMPPVVASFTDSSGNSFVYTAFGIQFISASIPQFYGILASTFISRPQLHV
jgi:hypothetical protein